MIQTTTSAGIAQNTVLPAVLSPRQKWVLDFLNVWAEEYCDGWVSPTTVGNRYGVEVLFKKGCHSATGSPILKELVKLGLAERNKKGWYRSVPSNGR